MTTPTLNPAAGGESPTQVVAVVQAKAKKRRARPRRALLGVAGILLFFACWELAARTGMVDARFLPPPPPRCCPAS